MFKKQFRLIFFTCLIILGLFSYPFLTPLQATGTKAELKNQLETAGYRSWGSAGEPNINADLASIVGIVMQTFLSLLGIIFIVLIVYAGYNWMTAGGSEDKVALAKNTLTRALIGLIIIIAAYAITYFVFGSLPGGGD